MIFIKNFRWVIIFLILILVPSSLLRPDGCYFSEESVAVSSDQRAVIIQNEDNVCITFSTAYTGDGKDFGWIIPVPVPPEEQDVREAGEDGEEVFRILEEYTAPVAITEDYSIGEGRGCFPAGTDVHTLSGLKPIETLSPGEEVFAYDFSSDQWTLSNVTKLQAYQYIGDMISIILNEYTIETTGNHLFYVLEGLRLNERPRSSEIAIIEPRMTEGGRWVEARYLKAGDLLKTRKGECVPVAVLHSRNVEEKVYHLEVEIYHNYAVSGFGVLVHNGGKQEPAGKWEVSNRLVEVYGTVSLEHYEASILGAVDVGALYSWLRENDYNADPDAGNVLAKYVDSGWAFIAVKMNPQEMRRYEDEYLPPVSIAFKFDKLVFPLHISSVSTVNAASITLYVIAESAVCPENFSCSQLRFDEDPREAVEPVTYIEACIVRTLAALNWRGMVSMWSGELEHGNVVKKLTGRPLGQGRKAWLTRLEARMGPEFMTDDIYLSASPLTKDVRVFFYSRPSHGQESDSSASIENIALRGAALNGESIAVRNLLKLQVDINEGDYDDRTALILASGRAHTGIVKMLLDADAQVNLKDRRGRSALLEAAGAGSAELVDVLLEAGADINASDGRGRTAVMISSIGGYTDILVSLLGAGADVNEVDNDGTSALHHAAKAGHADCVELLLRAGAEADAADAEGCTALIKAAICREPETVSVLLQAGANVNACNNNGLSALHEAARKGNVSVIRLLLDAGADPSLEAGSGLTALMIAENKRFERTAEALRTAVSVPESAVTGQWALDSDGFRRFYTEDRSLAGKWLVKVVEDSFQSRMTAVEAKVNKISGGDLSFGIVFCFTNAGNFYKFQIDSDGKYRISKYSDGRESLIIDWTVSEDLKEGLDTINLIKIIYLGNSTFEYYINDERGGVFTDTSFIGGRSGYYVSIPLGNQLPDGAVDIRYMQLQP